MISGGRREDEESARATHLWFCIWAMCAFSIMSSAHWHSPVRPVTAQAQTVGVGIRHTCYLHPSAGRERAASARSSRGTLGHAPLSKGQGPVDSQQLDSLRGSCAKPRSRSSAAPAENQAAFQTATQANRASQRNLPLLLSSKCGMRQRDETHFTACWKTQYLYGLFHPLFRVSAIASATGRFFEDSRLGWRRIPS